MMAVHGGGSGGGDGPNFSREILVSAERLAALRSPDPGPEELLIALEEYSPDDEDEEDLDELEQMRLIIRDFLPPAERRLLAAHFEQGQSQEAIAERHGTVKQSIQYRVHRAMQRVRWVRSLKTWRKKEPQIRRDLEPLESWPIDFAVVLWRCHWNQTLTARWYGANQGMARNWITALHCALAAAYSHERARPYFDDLDRVLQAREWSMGVSQVQGPRALRLMGHRPRRQ